MPRHRFRLGSVGVRVDADIELPGLREKSYLDFSIPVDSTGIHLTFRSLENTRPPSLPLNRVERENLLKTPGFRRRWLEYPHATLPQVRECALHPDLARLEFAWDRLLIRDYHRRSIYYFYTSNRRKSLTGPGFLALCRNTLAPMLVSFSTLLLHGAATAIGGKIALFLAPDGGGKTTLVRKFDPDSILNDDQVLADRREGEWRIFGTPFGTLHHPYRSGKPGGIFLLEKSSDTRLIPLTRRDAVKFIWDQHNHVWMALPPGLRTRAFKLVTDLVWGTPTHSLSLPRDFGDRALIDSTMAPSARLVSKDD